MHFQNYLYFIYIYRFPFIFQPVSDTMCVSMMNHALVSVLSVQSAYRSAVVLVLELPRRDRLSFLIFIDDRFVLSQSA